MADDDGEAKGLRAQLAQQAREIARLTTELTTASAQNQTWAAKEEQWTAQKASHATELAKVQADNSTLREDVALANTGLADPTGRVIARAIHGTLGADAPPLSDWVAAQKADPTKAPPGLAVYLQAGGATTTTTTSTTTTDPKTGKPKTVDTKAPGKQGDSKPAGDIDKLSQLAASGAATDAQRAQLRHLMDNAS